MSKATKKSIHEENITERWIELDAKNTSAPYCNMKAFARFGNGCCPNSLGSAVFVTFENGEMHRIERVQVKRITSAPALSDCTPQLVETLQRKLDAASAEYNARIKQANADYEESASLFVQHTTHKDNAKAEGN